MLKKIIISISITSFLSALIALSFYLVFNLSFLGIFIITFLLIFLFFYFWYGEQEKKLEKIINDRFFELSKQTAMVVCSYCKSQNIIPIRLDIDNECKCNNCGKVNAVYITIETTQKTIPILQAPQVQQELIDKLVETAIIEKNKNVPNT